MERRVENIRRHFEVVTVEGGQGRERTHHKFCYVFKSDGWAALTPPSALTSNDSSLLGPAASGSGCLLMFSTSPS